MEQKRIEHLLGLSQGLSFARQSGRHADSPMLVAELVLLRRIPSGASRS